jgi:hypothetical protein
MRIVVSNHNLRDALNGSRRVKRSSSPRPSPAGRGGAAERGVALVVTLIMLSLITFLAVAFLSLTRRERASVTVTVEQTDARLALDAGLARAQSDMITRLVEGNSFLSYDLLMSTNADNRAGLAPGSAALNNVSFFRPNPTPGLPANPDISNLVPPADLVQVISNLLFDPRVPVFAETNAGRPLDFRFYLDLNRNQTNDPADLVAGQPGDPHWVGLLQHPELPHSRTNKFIGRYAFIALPESKSLDLNFMHNYVNAALPAFMNGADGFARNQGFANWEFNLAGFLSELNPRYWQYTNYNPVNFFGPGGNGGTPFPQFDAFLSAKELLAYRYASNVNSLLAFDRAGFPNQSMYPGAGGLFEADGIDGYANGPLMFNTGSALSGDVPLPTAFPNDNVNASWPGSPNSNRFFSIEELVDRANQPRHPNFSQQMAAAKNASPPGPGANGPNDLNTFYRMVSQLSMDSAPAPVRRVPASARDDSRVSIIRVTLPNHGFNPDDWLRIRGTTNDGTFRVVATTRNDFDYELSFYYATNSFAVNQPTITIERNPKIHLNFDNFRYAENEFVPWSTRAFFMAASDRLLRHYTNFGPNLCVTNIQIYPTNQFNARVFQILKQVANILDRVDDNFPNRLPNEPDFPNIFRPIFTDIGTNLLYVSDFREFTNALALPAIRYLDPNNPATFVSNSPSQIMMTFGVPMIVGAEKGHPNINEIILRTPGFISRKLGFFKNTTNDLTPSFTNQMYHMGIKPSLGIELWNPYLATLPRSYTIRAVGEMFAMITNSSGQIVWGTNSAFQPNGPTRPWAPLPLLGRAAYSQNFDVLLTVPANTWPGVPSSFSFITLPFTNHIEMPVSKYTNQGPPTFLPMRPQWSNSLGNALLWYDSYERTTPSFYLPDWTYVMTNRVRYFLYDTLTDRLLDVVNVVLDQRVSIPEILQGSANIAASGQSPFRFWDLRLVGGGSNAPYRGIIEQITTATNANDQEWSGYNVAAVFSGSNLNTNKAIAAADFAQFLTTNTTKLSAQSPFNPVLAWATETAWGVNDPFVHYVSADYSVYGDTNPIRVLKLPDAYVEMTNAVNYKQFVSNINFSYRPWGGNRQPFGFDEDALISDYDVTKQDPLVRWADDWDFPTNYYGNIGWLGRVHRGTPWQSIYFKAGIYPTNLWRNWAGSPLTHPTNDWMLADYFTVSVDPDSRRGLLSVNQTNRAAWAAALSGVSVLGTNFVPFSSDAAALPPPNRSLFIAPNSPEFDAIVTGIERVRRAQPAAVFSNLASFLSVSELSATNSGGIVSPYLSLNGLPPPVRRVGSANPNSYMDTLGLDDVSYERIPQQVLSLLKVEEQPRFAVYVWGQSLKPADRSIVLSGSAFGLCTNYQVTGEVAAKAIVRVDRRVTPTSTNYITVLESYQLLPNP